MLHVGDAEFKGEVTDHKGVVVADFWAEWCSPCRMFGPVFEKVAGELSENSAVKFVKINVDKARKTASEYQIMSIPTVAVFRDGTLEEQSVGVLNEKKFREFVGKYL